MTVKTKITGASTPDNSLQNPAEIVAAAQRLRSEAVGKYLGRAARYVSQKLAPATRTVGQYFARRREVTELMALNDRELADIGLSRGDLFGPGRIKDRLMVPANQDIRRSVA